MAMKLYRKMTLLTLPITLIACAPPTPAPENPENEMMTKEERHVDISKVSRWNISGALAARTAKKGWSASVDWQQRSPGSYKIRLYGPLGSGNVIIQRQGGVVSFKDGNKHDKSSSAAQLLKRNTGVSLPVANLYYWVRGIPAPGGVSNKKYDRYNHLRSMQQNGYRIDYISYTSAGGTDLPSYIKVSGHQLKIKFIIKKWRI